MEALISHFRKYIRLDDEQLRIIESKIAKRKIKRRQMILQEGFVCKHYSFVSQGLFRMYGIDDKGFEHNIQFAAEGDWIADLGSFHSKKPSQLFIEALEPSEIIQIEQKDLYFLYLNILKLDRVFKVTFENKFIELQNRVLQTFSSTAEQRYLSFLEHYANLASRLPNTQIASYLGITPEFLSKIRKNLSNKS
jgi:CRP-like cAMP-binding protein